MPIGPHLTYGNDISNQQRSPQQLEKLPNSVPTKLGKGTIYAGRCFRGGGREESQEKLDAFASKNGYHIPLVEDKEESLFLEFAKTIIPRTYAIDHTGTIRFETIGFDQEKLMELDAKISELIEE